MTSHPWLSRDPRPLCLSVNDQSAVGEARRAASSLAHDLRFDETVSGRAALIATELATNLLKHAGPAGGSILLQPAFDAHTLEILALDKGPGIGDLPTSLRDGFSTAGSPGLGLGSLQRLSTSLDVFTQPGQGTAILARLAASSSNSPPPVSPSPGTPGEGSGIGDYPRPGRGEGSRNSTDSSPHLQSPPISAGYVNVPKRGETRCGDACACFRTGPRTYVMVADGLGHGPSAADAANEAVRVFRQTLSRSTSSTAPTPEVILRDMHDPLRKTRGAAVSIAQIDHPTRTLTFAGVGNVSAVLIGADGSMRSLISHNGTLGAEARKFQDFLYPFPPQTTLVLHSDGLTTHWKLDKHPTLLNKHPTLLAAVLYRDFSRGRDDATALALREI